MSKTFRVVPTLHGNGWEIRKGGKRTVVKTCRFKWTATKAARRMARRHQSGAFVKVWMGENYVGHKWDRLSWHTTLFALAGAITLVNIWKRFGYTAADIQAVVTVTLLLLVVFTLPGTLREEARNVYSERESS